jgi:hypothetical protein
MQQVSNWEPTITGRQYAKFSSHGELPPVIREPLLQGTYMKPPNRSPEA